MDSKGLLGNVPGGGITISEFPVISRFGVWKNLYVGALRTCVCSKKGRKERDARSFILYFYFSFGLYFFFLKSYAKSVEFWQHECVKTNRLSPV